MWRPAPAICGGRYAVCLYDLLRVQEEGRDNSRKGGGLTSEVLETRDKAMNMTRVPCTIGTVCVEASCSYREITSGSQSLMHGKDNILRNT